MSEALQRLRSRLQGIQNTGGVHDYDSDVTDTCTIEITEGTTNLTNEPDHALWLKRIQDDGNKAEDWLEFIQYMKHTAQYKTDKAYTSYMTTLYARAIKSINSEQHSSSLPYAHLLINCAHFKSTFSTDDARSFLHYARNNLKKLAIVHIASAQMEITHGNWAKAKKLLDKGQQFGSKPEELLALAVKNFNARKSPLIPVEDDEQSDNKENQAKEPVPDPEISTNIPTPKNVTMRSRKSNSALEKMHVMSLGLGKSESEKPFYTDTVDRAVRTMSESSDDAGTENLNFRVPKLPWINKPKSSVLSELPRGLDFAHHTELAQNSDPLQRARSQSPVSNRNVSVMDTTVSFGDFYKSRRHSGDVSDDNNTVPAPFDPNRGEYKRTLTRFNSTPVLRCSTKKTGKLTLGRPMRVKRSSLQQLREGSKTDDDDDDDTDNFRMYPLPETDIFNVAITDEDKLESSRARDQNERMECLGVCHGNDDDKEEDNGHHDSSSSKQDTDSGVVMPIEKPSIDKSNHDIQLTSKSTGPTATASTIKAAVITTQDKAALQPVQQVAPSVVAMQQPMIPMVMQHGGMMVPAGMVPAMMPMMPTLSRPTETLVIRGKVYTIMRMLGSGGSSKVYDTLDPGYNLRAVKCVNLNNADDATIESYKNEIALLKRLQHSNKVVKLFDYEYVESANVLYVVMERGDTDLASFFRQCTKNDGIDTLMQKFYWMEMLKAVQVLHKEGIVHSDLKPANFLLVQGKLKLIDFGIAKALHQDMTSITRDQQVGTLNYMSPEAILDTCGGTHKDSKGRIVPKIKIGVKSDVWSLGCILYNIVYGKTPFHSISNNFLKLQAITNPQVEINFPETVDRGLRDIIMKCLRRDPKERPSISELLSTVM